MGMADPLAVTLNADYSQARGRKEMFDRFHEREHDLGQSKIST
jgi:hypothetical protein